MLQLLVVAVVLNVPGALTPGLVIVTVLVLAAMAAQLLRFRAEARALARLVDAVTRTVAEGVDRERLTEVVIDRMVGRAADDDIAVLLVSNPG